MSVSGLMNIGLTAMQTTNQLLDITAHNIANANTPGYTRQEAIIQSVPSGSINTTGSTGNGVQIADIQRMYNAFVNSQLNTENSNLSYWNNYQTGITQVEDVFNEASTTGISPAINSFFNAWQTVAQNPQDVSQRTTLIQDASYLSSRLNAASASLNDERSQLFTDSQSLVSQVNSLAAQIADLNAKIAGNSGALDLMDQRDTLVQQLNQIVKVSSFQDPTPGNASSYQDPMSGSVNILVGGTPLVEGGNHFNMTAATDTANNMRFYVAVVPNAAQGTADNPEVTSLLTGGQLKANLDLRDTKIPAYLTQLNAFAVDLADSINSNQKQGYGLDGSPGGNLFQSLSMLSKYTSTDSVSGTFTSPTAVFSSSGGALTIKLGDNDTSPVTVNVLAGSTLQQTVADINTQAGSKVSATVVNLGPATEFTVNNTNNSFTTLDKSGNLIGTVQVPQGTYTAVGLQNAINTAAIAGGAEISAKYNSTTNTFTITPAAGGVVTQINFTPASSSLTNIGGLIGFSDTKQSIAITGSTGSALCDYRMGIKSNPDGNLGEVRIGVSNTADGAGSGLNLLATSSMLSNGSPGSGSTDISSVNVTDSSSMNSAAQYKIDYVNPFNIISGVNDKIAFNYGTDTYTATIAAGSYSGSGLASAISSALNSAIGTVSGNTLSKDNSGNVFNVDWGITKSNELTITNTSTTSDVTNLFNAAGNTATPSYFGFPADRTNISKNGGTLQSASLASAYVINSSNNKIVFNDGTNNNTYTATIAAGAYSGDGLAAAIQNALNMAVTPPAVRTSNTFSVDFGVTSPNELSIKNSSGDPVSIDWTSSTATPRQLGFAGVGNTTTITAGVAGIGPVPAAVPPAPALTIDGTNDTLVFNDGVADRTATISHAVYGSVGALASAVETAMNNAENGALGTTGVNYYTVVDDGTGKLQINNGTASSVTLRKSSTAISVGADALGFDQAADSTVPASTNPGVFSATSGVSSGYQADASGLYWRVQKSTDGATWTTINPNTLYNPSNGSTPNETEVNLTNDTAGSSWRTLEFEGMKVRIDGNGINSATGSATNPNGETFGVQLDPNAASDIATVITDPKQIAASTDTFTVDSTNNSVVFNVNGGANITATIPAGSYTNDPGQSDDISSALTTAIQTAYQNATGNPLPDTLNVSFDPNTKQFKIAKATGDDPVQLQWGNSTAQSLFGFSSSSPTITNAGDFMVSDNPGSVLSSANTGVPGDNRNASTIAALANGTSFGGTTPVDFYNALVSSVGVESASAKSNQQYQSNLVDQLTQRQSEVSGVSMDQEAANLVIYQKSYQAAAQLINVANTLLTTLMTMVSSGTAG